MSAIPTFFSVVIPAYNEVGRIAPTLRSIIAYMGRQSCPWEIIVVDDGSRDETNRKVRDLLDSPANIRLIQHRVNQGKGAAVRTGLLASRGTAVLFCDADGATPIEELSRLLEGFGRGVPFVVGSRRVAGSQVVLQQSWYRRLMSDCYQGLCRLLLAPGVSDITCGFKLLSREAVDLIAPRMRVNGWSFDAEMFTIARIHRIKVKEIPVRWAHQQRTKVQLARDTWISFIELLQILIYAARGTYR